jgi:hypothetical protein
LVTNRVNVMGQLQGEQKPIAESSHVPVQLE